MKKEAKHTPGPWRYCKTNGSPTHGEHVIAGAKPGYLAEVRDCGSGDVGANARLIAAAPELLTELQAAHQIIRNALAVMSTKQKLEWGRRNARDGVEGEGVTRANEREAVIARATGQER